MTFYWFIPKKANIGKKPFPTNLRILFPPHTSPNQTKQSFNLIELIRNICFTRHLTNSIRKRIVYTDHGHDEVNGWYNFFGEILKLISSNKSLFQKNNISVFATLVVIHSEQSFNSILVERAIQFLHVNKRLLSFPNQVSYQLVKEKIPDFFCSNVIQFHVVPSHPCLYQEYHHCIECKKRAPLSEMGIITGKRLTCSSCVPEYGNSLRFCFSCFVFFPKNERHKCDMESAWQCRICFLKFQSKELPDSICDRCFLGHPPFESKHSTVDVNYPVVFPLEGKISDDQCSVCFDHGSTNLVLICSNPQCFAKAHTMCAQKTFEQPGPGKIFYPSRLLCPFCRKVPNLSIRTNHSSFFSILQQYSSIKFDESKSYAMCLQCRAVKEVPKLSCSATDSQLNFTCQDCQRCVKSEKFKQCPGCGIYTEKDGGCNHITCSVCNTDWCYKCEQRYFGHICPGETHRPDRLRNPNMRNPNRRNLILTNAHWVSSFVLLIAIVALLLRILAYYLNLEPLINFAFIKKY